MKIVILASNKDKASLNIGRFLDDVYYFNEEPINLDNIDDEINADFFIFISKHQSKDGIPSLTVHTPGNFGKAETGGFDSELCIAPACYLKEAFLELNKIDLPFEKTLECTHHGPFLNKPCIFIEIGSTLKEWENEDAGKAIANVVKKLLMIKPSEHKIGFGIGGTHYCSVFNKIILKTDIAVGHICPKYHLKNLNKEMILKAISRTKEKVDFVILDWKGLGTHKARIVSILNELGLNYKRSDQIL